jgi:4-amino-4-deoxy-L-arabinose transferase-like glycosyltransferase
MIFLKRYWLFLILALAVVIRCLGLATRGIQYDDAFSIFLAQRSLPEIVRGTAADTMPPLYYFILHFWLQISQSVEWLRLLSILFSLGIVVFLYLMIRVLFGHGAGLWAALFAAISPLQYYHAQDIRMYALLGCAQLAYTWLFVVIWKNENPNNRARVWRWTGMVIAGIAAMYTHNLAIFFLIVPDVFLLLTRNWRLLGKMMAAQVLIALASLPWLMQVPGQVDKIQRAFWTPSPGLVEVIQAVIVGATNLPLSGVWLGVGLVLSIELLVFILLEIIRYRGDGSKRVLVLLMTFVPPALLFAASYIIRPVFVPRGFLASLAVYLGLAGVIVARRWPKPVAAGVALSMVIAAMIGVPQQVSFAEFPRSPFQDAGAFLNSHIGRNDIVLHDNKLSYFPMRYYWPAMTEKFLPDVPGTPNDTYAPGSQMAMAIFPETNLNTAVGQAQRVYFVVFQETIQEYQAAGQADHPQLIDLRKTFHQTNIYTFQDLLIYQFER